MTDHVQMMISIPPEVCGVERGGYIMNKSAINLARAYSERKRHFVGQGARTREYFVSTVV